MLFKNFEIRPTSFLDGHIDPYSFDLVKWYDHEPVEAVDMRTGEPKVSTRSCYSIATLKWDKGENWWEIGSVGTRLIEEWVEGLDRFIFGWCEYAATCVESNQIKIE